jgi:sodium--glutamate symport carrier gltS
MITFFTTIGLGVLLAKGLGVHPLLVLPFVGAFFIDFTNALIITMFLNLVQ